MKNCIQKKRGDAELSKFRFVYFSYQPDFQYLKLSIQTLIHNVPPNILDGVVIAVDQKSPFNTSQESELIDIYTKLSFIPIHNFSWGSAISTYEELKIFSTISHSLINPYDYLVKVDSDVLFLPSSTWLRVAKWFQPAIGDGHFTQYRYAQGGLYMLTRSVISDVLSQATIEQIDNINHKTDSVGEDSSISEYLRLNSHPFYFIRLMLFPDEYKHIQRINRRTNSEFVAMHFHKDKSNMNEYAIKFNLI